jgi:hypothetical protein
MIQSDDSDDTIEGVSAIITKSYNQQKNITDLISPTVMVSILYLFN